MRPLIPHLAPRGFRAMARKRAFPLKEHPLTSDPEYIREWLDVERSARWQPKGNLTYCNIYVYDYLYLLGIPFPRVWWRDDYVEAGFRNKASIEYGVTVRELNVNALVPWMEKYGKDFGWEVSTSPDILLKDDPHYIGVVLASNKNRKRSGHTSIVYLGAETEETLFQSQAGSRNKKLFQGAWWKGSSFKKVLFCRHRL